MLGQPEIQLKRGFAKANCANRGFLGRFSSNCAEKILFELQNCKEA